MPKLTIQVVLSPPKMVRRQRSTLPRRSQYRTRTRTSKIDNAIRLLNDGFKGVKKILRGCDVDDDMVKRALTAELEKRLDGEDCPVMAAMISALLQLLNEREEAEETSEPDDGDENDVEEQEEPGHLEEEQPGHLEEEVEPGHLEEEQKEPEHLEKEVEEPGHLNEEVERGHLEDDQKEPEHLEKEEEGQKELENLKEELLHTNSTIDLVSSDGEQDSEESSVVYLGTFPSQIRNMMVESGTQTIPEPHEFRDRRFSVPMEMSSPQSPWLSTPKRPYDPKFHADRRFSVDMDISLGQSPRSQE